MSLTLKDVVRCPGCSSAQVIFSCEPKCCFNHVCADCRGSFQLVTQKTGRFDHQTVIQAEEPPSGDPTACCAACESLKLAIVSSDAGATTLLCADCRALLKLVIEEFAPSQL